MKLPGLNVETVALFVLGCILLLSGGSGIHLFLLSPTDNAYLWNRSNVLAGMLLGYGAALVGMSFWSLYLATSGLSLAGEISRHASDVRALIRDHLLPPMRRAFEPGRALGWLFMVLCLGIAVRAYFLAQPVRYDEAYTFLNFVNGPLLPLFDYAYPNNHVLHTILMKLSTMLFGAHPASLRLPAFIAGIASIPLMFCLARTLSRDRSATFATVIIAVFPYLILYSTNARGYSIVVFLTLALIWVAAQTAQSPSIAASAVLSIIGAFGLLTIPSTAFAVAGVYLWYGCLLLINGTKLKRMACDFAVPCAVMTAGLTAFLYTPVIFVSNGIEPIIDNEYVKAQPSAEFFSRIYPHFAATLADFSRDIPGPVVILCLGLMAIGTYGAAKNRNWPVLLLLPAALAASTVLFFIKHAIPFPRTWIFLIPIAILQANAGLAYCLETFPGKPRRFINYGIVLAGACYALFLVSSNAMARYPDTGTFPEAPRIAGYLKPLIKEGDEVHASVPADYPTYFYLWYNGVRDFRAKEHDTGDAMKYFVVQKSGHFEPNAIQDRIDEPVQKIFDIRDAAIFRTRPAKE